MGVVRLPRHLFRDQVHCSWGWYGRGILTRITVLGGWSVRAAVCKGFFGRPLVYGGGASAVDLAECFAAFAKGFTTLTKCFTGPLYG